MNDGHEGIAKWRRIADALRREIGAGALDEQLPPEAELAERFGVNRHTLRRALAVLSAEGLLRAERGRGTFLQPPPARLSYPIGARTRFSEIVAAQSREPAGRLISADRMPADSQLAEALGLRIGASIHRLETLHVADGIPLSVATSFFCATRFPGIVTAYAETGSITRALAAGGLADYRRRETRILAERASPADAAHLGLGSDGIVLVASAIDVDPDGQPVQMLRTRFAAERMELVIRP